MSAALSFPLPCICLQHSAALFPAYVHHSAPRFLTYVCCTQLPSSLHISAALGSPLPYICLQHSAPLFLIYVCSVQLLSSLHMSAALSSPLPYICLLHSAPLFLTYVCINVSFLPVFKHRRKHVSNVLSPSLTYMENF